MPYQAVYYRDDRGREPVNDYVDELDGVCQESIDWKIGLLNQLSDSNPDLPFPHSSQLKGTKYRAFRELRAGCGRKHYRIIFRRSERFFILLHIIHKNTGETPRGSQGDRPGSLEGFRGADGRRSPREPARDGARRTVTKLTR